MKLMDAFLRHRSIKNYHQLFVHYYIILLFLLPKKNQMRKILLAIAFFINLLVHAQDPCSPITVTAPSEVQPGVELIFNATISVDNNITYNWSVSNGSISAGQGTAIIKIDTKGLAGEYITATVDIGGLPRGCSTSSSATAYVMEGAKPTLLVMGEYTNEADFSGNMKLMIANLGLPPNDNGSFQFHLSPDEKSDLKQIDAIKKIVKKNFAGMKIPETNYKIIDGKKTTTTSYMLWYLPKGTVIPNE